jgi:hypothetical protein
MKYFLNFFLIVILPFHVHSQDTTVLKQQVAMMAGALLKGNYYAVVDNTYPRAVMAYGGRQQMVKTLNNAAEKMKSQGMTLTNAIIGSPGSFFNTATSIQCLVPESLIIKTDNLHMVKHTWLLAISADNGKRWYFIDLNAYSMKNMHTIVPDLSPNITLPAPEKPGYFSN